MSLPIYTPRVNNNDDTVLLSQLLAVPGSFVRKGAPLAEVETDKATFMVEAEQDGYLLRFEAKVGETIGVGSVLAWLGEDAHEAAPEKPEFSRADTSVSPTLKAMILLAQHNLDASLISAKGDRLTAEDIERHLAERTPRVSAPPALSSATPSEPGQRTRLAPSELGMLRTVLWQKAEAAPAYVEITYDPAPWAEYAADFQKQHGLMMNPLLPLLTWRLASIAANHSAANSTLVGEEKYRFEHVNVGFTVQAGDKLYVVVVREAEAMEPLLVSQTLGDLQRSAMRHSLRPDQIEGATVGFSSMARWNVSRHVPILLKNTSLMIAHTAAIGTTAVLGATYDHRLLSGADALGILQRLSRPLE